MRGFLLVLMLAAINQPVGAQSASSNSDLAAARWLSGCWEMRVGTRVTQEQWTTPAGGAMLGMSRTIVGDSLRDWEFVLLGPDSSGLAYQVRPARQADTSFPATFISDTLLSFESPLHDFPQRITYRRHGRDSLLARIEGPIDGQQRSVDFPYARVACPNGR